MKNLNSYTPTGGYDSSGRPTYTKDWWSGWNSSGGGGGGGGDGPEGSGSCIENLIILGLIIWLLYYIYTQ